ncbi:MAG: hypothetical protein MZV64_27925 [Ignavibacteriales bacterium]|nr:hypothetical protein [Ignavibacteriales bacterium]
MPVFAAVFLIVDAVVHRAAGPERVRGRVPDPAGRLPGERRLYAVLAASGRHPGRGLHAVDVPAGDVRPGDARGEPRARRPDAARDGGRWRRVLVLIVWIGIYPAAVPAHDCRPRWRNSLARVAGEQRAESRVPSCRAGPRATSHEPRSGRTRPHASRCTASEP